MHVKYILLIFISEGVRDLKVFGNRGIKELIMLSFRPTICSLTENGSGEIPKNATHIPERFLTITTFYSNRNDLCCVFRNNRASVFFKEVQYFRRTNLKMNA